QHVRLVSDRPRGRDDHNRKDREEGEPSRGNSEETAPSQHRREGGGGLWPYAREEERDCSHQQDEGGKRREQDAEEARVVHACLEIAAFDCEERGEPWDDQQECTP